MERIKNLSKMQKVLMIIIVVMIIAFSIIYPIIMAIKGIEFRGDFLTKKEGPGNVTYTDEYTSITVYDDQRIEFKCYHRFTGDEYRDITYGPYSWMEDPSVIPAGTEDGMLSSDDYIGVKIMEGDKVFFRGAVSKDGYCGFTDSKPVLLIVGGSSGSVIINNAIRENLDKLLETFNVIHLCGKDNLDESLKDKKGYVQYEYVKKELASMLALCDIIISRAGANAICELLALRKPNILIPLSKAASRGDQILNAQSFEKSGYSYVIQEEELNTDTLFAAIHEVYNNKGKYIQAMESSNLADSTGMIVNMIEELVNSND